MSQERVKLPAVGGSSLLVIFTVLCLTVFALLGLETVRANCRLTDAAADSVASYYAADAQAESIVALLRTGEIPDYVLQDEDVCTFACTAGDTPFPSAPRFPAACPHPSRIGQRNTGSAGYRDAPRPTLCTAGARPSPPAPPHRTLPSLRPSAAFSRRRPRPLRRQGAPSFP